MSSVAFAAAPKEKDPPKTEALVKTLLKAKTGAADRDEIVKELIKRGHVVWTTVDKELKKIRALDGGEDLAMRLLIGLRPDSYERIAELAPSLDDRRAKALIDLLVKQPSSPVINRILAVYVTRSDATIVMSVLPLLVARGYGDVMQQLVTFVDDRRDEIRTYAIETLTDKAYGPAMPVFVRLLGIEQLRASESNLRLRHRLIRAIGRVGGDAGVNAVIDALQLADQREAALDALVLMGSPAVQAILLLLKTGDPARLETAIAVIDRMRDNAAPALIELLESRSPETRALAMDILAYLAAPTVKATLLRMVREKRFPEWKEGLRLVMVYWDADVREMVGELLDRSDVDTRLFVLGEVWKLRDPETFKLIRAVAASDSERRVRIRALEIMVTLGDPQAAPTLRRMVEVPGVDERLEIFNSLARIDGLEAVAPLASQLSDANEAVFRAALSALQRVTFHKGPRRELDWKQWLKQWQGRDTEKWEREDKERGTFKVDGRTFGFEAYGKKDAPTIVVMSGPPFTDAAHLLPHVWRLGKWFRVVALRRSTPNDRAANVTFATQSRELEGLLTTLAVRPAILLVDAGAGAFALRYGTEHPRDVSAVILHGGPWPTPEALDALVPAVEGSIAPAFREDVMWATRHPDRIAPAVSNRVLLRAALTAVLANEGNALRVTLGTFPPDALTSEALDRARMELEAWDPATATAQTLVLAGAKTPWALTTRRDVTALAKKKKNIAYKEISKAGWMPLLETPGEAVDAIRDFIGD